MIWLELYGLIATTLYLIMLGRSVKHYAKMRPFPWRDAAIESVVVVGLSVLWPPILLGALVWYFKTRR